MKQRIFLAVIVVGIAFAFSGPDKLVNKPMPYFEGKTISGVKVDTSFFRNKVTLIDFMYIGCPPCAKEMKQLIKLNKENTSSSFQILGISANTEQQLKDFNSTNSTMYSQVRKNAKLDSIEYFLMPECATESVKKKPNSLGAECNTVSKLFKVFAYPQTFLVDKKGIIRYAFSGYVSEQDEEAFMQELKEEIKKLLAE